MEKRTIFIANLSHEIRTPLNAILGYAQLGLSSTGGMDEQKKYFEKINTSAKQLMSLLDTITDFATVKSSQFTLNSHKINFSSLMAFLMTHFQPAAQEKSLTFQVNVSSPLPETFHGDAYRIEQLLTHLIDNAIRFTAEGQITIDISSLPAEVADESSALQTWLQFEVSDSGPGIPEQRMNTIFRPFSALEFDSQARYSGLSLGLPLCQALIEHMSGKLTIENKADHGLKVTVSFPVTTDAGSSDGYNQSVLSSGKVADSESFVMPDFSNLAPKLASRTTFDALNQLQEYADLKKPTQCKAYLNTLRARHRNIPEWQLVLDHFSYLIVHYRFTEASKLIEQLMSQIGGDYSL